MSTRSQALKPYPPEKPTGGKTGAPVRRRGKVVPPGTGSEIPPVGRNVSQVPENASQAPRIATQVPGSGAQAREDLARAEVPGNVQQAPVNVPPVSEDVSQAPADGVQAPADGVQALEDGVQAMENGVPVAGSSGQAPEFVPSARVRNFSDSSNVPPASSYGWKEADATQQRRFDGPPSFSAHGWSAPRPQQAAAPMAWDAQPAYWNQQQGGYQAPYPPQMISNPDLLQLLAQQQEQFAQQQQQMAQQNSVLTELARGFSQQQQSWSTTQAAPPPTTHTTAQPPVVRGLPTPKLQSPDSTTIPQFRDWKQRWEDYSKAQQLQHQPIDTQHGVLRSALDTEWTILWNSGRIPVTTVDPLDKIVDQMEAYLRSRRNPLLDRQLFHRRDQMAGESVDRYYAALKTLDDAAAHEIELTCSACPAMCQSYCEECQQLSPLEEHLQQTRIRDRLICGLRDKEMQKKVLAEDFSTLNLDQVLAICSAVENSNRTGATLSSNNPYLEVSAAKAKSSYKKQQQHRPPTSGQQKSSFEGCWYCGNPKYHQRSECKAKNELCRDCNQMGHYANRCKALAARGKEFANRRNAKQRWRQGKGKPAGSNKNGSATNAAVQQLLTVEATIAGTPHLIQWLPDTGAQVDAISENDFRKLGEAAQTAFSSEIEDVVAANGVSLGPVGSARATLKLNGREYTTLLRVFKSVTTPLLSKRGCIALGLIDPQWPYSRLRQAGAISECPPLLKSPQAPNNSSTARDEILKEFAAAFNDEVLRPMEGEPMKIEILDSAVPSKRYKAHTIPFHWRDQVKEQLETMEKKGIIERVPMGEAIDWCHPMVVVPKKGSSEPRITVDLTGLNKFVRRPAYPVRVPKEVVSRVPPGNMYFTTLDARHGYWQVPLDEDSKKLTTFITPWGSYRFQRNVMGLISAGDEHNRRGDEALEGIENVEKIVEDILIYDKDLPTHKKRVREVIQRCQDHGITLNPKKFNFAQSSVEWCGFHIGPEGYTPAPHLVSALLKFPTPTSKTDVRSFCGLVQQFEAFSHRITELIAPIRSLLSSKAVFLWETVHEKSFQEVIKELASPRVLTHFQPGYPLRLETDAAQSKGLGYALYQQQPDTKWKLLQAGSRYVTPTESRYSASEIEMLAVVWAIKKCRLFLLGQPFELVVDHRPLIPIINSKTLDEIENPRLQRLKEKLSSFRLTAIWRAGTKHTVVDVFSRFPVADPDEEDLEVALDDDPTPYLNAALHDAQDGSRIVDDPLLRGIKEATRSCSVSRRLREHIEHGFPEKCKLDEDLHPFWRYRDSLTTHQEMIFLGSRILIPDALRPSVLATLHSSHQGQERSLRRARQAIFWPNITNDIKNVVRSCRDCQSHLPSLPKEPLQPEPTPSFQFETVGADHFSYAGYEYLVMVDQFSGWPCVAKCGTSATTGTVTKFLQIWMTDLGIPVKFRSDNGPQFASSEFQGWCGKWGIQHMTSSPHYPQSNGLAESAVKSVKYLLEKTAPTGDIGSSAFQEGLMELRNTPRPDGRSPAQLLFGAPTRTRLPLHRSQFMEQWRSRSRTHDERAEKLREKARQRFDESAHPLSKLAPGTIVLIQHHVSKRWTMPAEVLEICPSGRSYLLRTEGGRVLRRNRRFVRMFHGPRHPAPEVTPPPPPPRRSSRHRRPPVRFANALQGFQANPFKGGLGGLRDSMHHGIGKRPPTRSPSTPFQMQGASGNGHHH